MASSQNNKQKVNTENTKSKRKRNSLNRVGLDNAQLPSHLRLRAMKVSQKTLTRYLLEIREFESWLKSKRQRWTRDTVDNKVTKYITHLYETDADFSQASYLIYGLQLLHCDVAKQAFLVNSKLALSGWRKQSPGEMRVPVPEEFLFDLMQFGIDNNRVDISMAMLIQYDGYLRPSECLTLTKDHV